MVLKRLWMLMGLLVVFFAVTAMTPGQQQTARIYLQPVTETETTLVVDVVVDNVSRLSGIDFQILFDPTTLTVQDAMLFQQGVQIEPGVLFPKSDSFIITNQVDMQQGIISFVAVTTAAAFPPNQGGVVARLTFSRRQPAPLALQFQHARLISADLQPLPLQTITLLLDSRIPQNIEATTAPMLPKTSLESEAAFPWWLVATLIMVLGLLTLGGYLLLHNNGQGGAPLKPGKPAEPETTRFYTPAKSAAFDNSHRSPV